MCSLYRFDSEEDLSNKRGFLMEVLILQWEAVKAFLEPRPDNRRAFIYILSSVYFINQMISIRMAMIQSGIGAAIQIKRMGKPRCAHFELNIGISCKLRT